MNFFLEMDPPTVTAQEHRVMVRNGKPMFYDSAKLKAARKQFVEALELFAPDEPMKGGIRLSVTWYFRTKTHPDDSYRITKPDTDNLQKLLKDCMTVAGFWKDDCQVCSEKVIKRWSRGNPGIFIIVENVEEYEKL